MAEQGPARCGQTRYKARGRVVFEYSVDRVINGLTSVYIYVFIAIGYMLIYGIIGMTNFANSELLMTGAFHSLIVLSIDT